MKNKTIIVTGGGTGGHLSVAKSFIEQFYTQGYEVIFIGSSNGADKSWFQNEKMLKKSYFFDTVGVVNKGKIGKIISLFKIIKAMFVVIFIIKKNNISKVISVGGFSAASASFASILTKTDFYIHEQNSVMGSLNRLTSKFAKEIFSSYDEKAKIKDYPINNIFFKNQRIRENINTIIFLGGSQGARAINDLAIKLAPLLKKRDINIIHQTGKKDYIRVKDEYKKLKIDIELFDFSANIINYMVKADFAISRSGASTLWELSALGLPTLYIPYPYASANHQYHNAKFLLDKKLCLLKYEKDLDEMILENIFNLDIKYMSSNLVKSIKKDGIKHIINTILEE